MENVNANQDTGSGNSTAGRGEGNPGHGSPNVHIEVDGHNKSVRAGDWLVSDLKQKVGVDPAKALAEITPTGLVDLDDQAHIDVKEGLRFMSHARTGGSS